MNGVNGARSWRQGDEAQVQRREGRLAAGVPAGAGVPEAAA